MSDLNEFNGKRILVRGLVDPDVDGVVIKGKGHWLMEEAPQEVIPRLVAFINKSPEVRE